MQHKALGFSLIELITAMAIMAILIAMGLPSFTTYLANTKVRANAESLISGLQLARADALRRNASVEFLLTNSSATEANVATATPSISGTNWIVRTTDGAYIDGKQGSDSGGSRVSIVPSADSIIFNNFGGANPSSRFDLSYDGDSCVADGGPIRCLRIEVTIGGRVRMCDPAATAANDTRGC